MSNPYSWGVHLYLGGRLVVNQSGEYATALCGVLVPFSSFTDRIGEDVCPWCLELWLELLDAAPHSALAVPSQRRR